MLLQLKVSYVFITHNYLPFQHREQHKHEQTNIHPEKMPYGPSDDFIVGWLFVTSTVLLRFQIIELEIEMLIFWTEYLLDPCFYSKQRSVYTHRYDNYPAAVVHAAEHHGVRVTVYTGHKTYRADAHGTRGRLRVADLEASSQHQCLWIIRVTLDQHVDVPFAVHEQMLSWFLFQAERVSQLLDSTPHQILHLLLSHSATHGEEHILQRPILRPLRSHNRASQAAGGDIHKASHNVC